MNSTEFELRWNEPPLGMSMIRGLRFMRRNTGEEEEDPEPEADGNNRLGPERDTEWETETEEGTKEIRNRDYMRTGRLPCDHSPLMMIETCGSRP